MKIKEGNFDAKGLSFSIVISRFNEVVSKGLLDGALDCLKSRAEKAGCRDMSRSGHQRRHPAF